MIVERFRDAKEYVAGDGTSLREVLRKHMSDSGAPFSIAHAYLGPGGESAPHRLKTSTEIYYVISGAGAMHVGDESSKLGEGDSVMIPPGKVQYITNMGGLELEILCLVYPPWRAEDDENV